MSEYVEILQRPRRNRKSPAIRRLVQETQLLVSDMVWPMFLVDGVGQKQPVESMPGVFRLSLDLLIEQARQAFDLGINAIALFPAIEESKKSAKAEESYRADGLLPKSVMELKKQIPELCVITDVAMDPYSSDGHDGIVQDGKILNDPTLEILGKMALCQAQAGADMVAPSDMMDGRVGYIRQVLDANGFGDVGILSYAAKYASYFYGPFRQALDSAPKSGDKKTYQMDPSNRREALREVALDISEGADIVMVKPALSYLDIIREISQSVDIPVAAYNVSGEYSMVKAAAQKGWLQESAVVLELLTSMKRAGADMIFTYHAMDVAQWLK